MKRLFLSLSLTFGLLASQPSYALVLLVNSCETPDGQYSVVVTDNRGTGPVRTSHLAGAVRDAEGKTLGSWEVTEVKQAARSASFGHQEWRDSDTDGANFRLTGPSTNFPYVSVSASLASGEQLVRKNLRCSVWNSRVLGAPGEE